MHTISYANLSPFIGQVQTLFAFPQLRGMLQPMEPELESGQNPRLQKFYHDLHAVLEDGESLLKAGVERVRERARLATEKTDRAIRERPYQALGLMFGVGVVVGLVVSGLLKRHSSD